ncbi:MAG TPA: FGLLP motif-containing membrane protein [Gaiellaceae bacterium]
MALATGTPTLGDVTSSTQIDDGNPDVQGRQVVLRLATGATGPLEVRIDAVDPTRPGTYPVAVFTSRDGTPATGSFPVVAESFTATPASVAPSQDVSIHFVFTAQAVYLGAFHIRAPPGWTGAEKPSPFVKRDPGQTVDLEYDGRSPAGAATDAFTLTLAGRVSNAAKLPVGERTIASVDVPILAAGVGVSPTGAAPGDRVVVTPSNVPASCPKVVAAIGTAELATFVPRPASVQVPSTTPVGPATVELYCSDASRTPLASARIAVTSTVTSTTTPTTTTVNPPPPRPAIRVVPTAGRAGSTFSVSGTGLPSSCARPSLYLGSYRLGSPSVVGGSFADRVLRVPVRARPATTQVSLHCGTAQPLVQAAFAITRAPAPPLRATISVDPSAGARGSTFSAVARSVPRTCRPGDVYLGSRRVGSADASGGALSDGPLVVPVRSRSGATRVVLRCAGRVVAAAPFAVTGARDHRTAFALAAPGDGFLHHRRVLADAGLVALALLLLVALIGFPADWFNDTYVENRERLRAAWWRLLGRAEPPRRPPTRLGLAAFLVVAGALTCAATDWPTFDRAYLWTLMGTTAGVAALTFGFQLPAILSARAVHLRGRLQVLAGSVCVAAVCVAASRALHLDPPYLYGLIAVFVVEREEDDAAGARDAALGAVATLGLSVGAWLLDLRIRGAAAAAAPSPGVLALDAALVTVFVAGLGSMVFALVPLPFLPGRAILRWRRGVWVALFAVGAYAFALIMLTPRDGYVANVPWNHVAAALVTFAVFALVSVAFMAWLRFTRPRRDRPEAWPSRSLN